MDSIKETIIRDYFNTFKPNQMVKVDLWKVAKSTKSDVNEVKMILAYMEDDMFVNLGQLKGGVQEVIPTQRGIEHFRNLIRL